MVNCVKVFGFYCFDCVYFFGDFIFIYLFVIFYCCYDECGLVFVGGD